MDKEKVKRMYNSIESVLLEENCTYEEAELTLNKIKETYFNRKASKFLKHTMFQKLASIEI